MWLVKARTGALVVSTLLASTGMAAEFHASGTTRLIHDGVETKKEYDVSGLSQAGDGRAFTGPNQEILAAVSSLADIGGLRANAHGAVRESSPNVSLGYHAIHNGNGTATATYEVTITGPTGPVQASFNMHLGGTMEAASTATATGLNAASAGMAVTFRVNGTTLLNVAGTSGFVNISRQAGGSLQRSALGVLDDWTSPTGTITSPSFVVDAGSPFTLQIELSVSAQGNAHAPESGFVAAGNADFGSTLRFVTDGPVFNLPAGYTVHAPDAGITDNGVPCTVDCTHIESTCDAGKLTCVAKHQACLLKVHATAEKNGEAPNAKALAKCHAAFDGGNKGPARGCVGKLETKQNPAKPKTLCSASDQLPTLAGLVDGFVTEVVTTIDPAFPAHGPASTCDAGKKICVLKRASCFFKQLAKAAKTGDLADAARIAKCVDQFNGGAKGFNKGCLGKLEAKQKLEKPKTLCAVTGDVTILEGAVEAFVADAAGAIRHTD